MDSAVPSAQELVERPAVGRCLCVWAGKAHDAWVTYHWAAKPWQKVGACRKHQDQVRAEMLLRPPRGAQAG